MTDLQRLFSDLIRFEIELWDAVDARLRVASGLPLGRFEVLQVIARLGNCRVFDIADALSVTVGGTSKLVDRLEASGYCRRRANPDDRRSSLIELTPAGREVLSRATTAFEDELELRFATTVSDPELQQFGTTLRTLRSAGQQIGSTPGTSA